MQAHSDNKEWWEHLVNEFVRLAQADEEYGLSAELFPKFLLFNLGNKPQMLSNISTIGFFPPALTKIGPKTKNITLF